MSLPCSLETHVLQKETTPHTLVEDQQEIVSNQNHSPQQVMLKPLPAKWSLRYTLCTRIGLSNELADDVHMNVNCYCSFYCDQFLQGLRRYFVATNQAEIQPKVKLTQEVLLLEDYFASANNTEFTDVKLKAHFSVFSKNLYCLAHDLKGAMSFGPLCDWV